MASDDELEPTQTQSQTHNSEGHVWINVDNDPDIWGRLLAKNVSLQNFGKYFQIKTL